MRNIILITILLAVASCSTKSDKPSYKLGELNHQLTIAPQALKNFNEGLLFLHSFEYGDAKEAFLEAQNDDSNELMAYWGEAMCQYKALWGLQNVPAGREVIAKVGNTVEQRLALADNDLEKGFWEGVEILYGEGEFNERNLNYAKHMEELYERYPQNEEVAAFYSLGLIWAAHGEYEQDFLNKASEIASFVLDKNPVHPGALHYKIHSNDDPEYAKIAKLAADKYAAVAPDAAHALHMPSHIYVALGLWNEVVNSNIDAYAASIHRMERKNLSGRARDYHSMAWLQYGYLQQGNFRKAAELVREMISYYKDSVHSKRYLIMMQNELRIESEAWPEDIVPVMINLSPLGLSDKSGQHFFSALRAFDNKDIGGLEREMESLANELEVAKLLVTDDGVALCSAGPTNYAPNKVGVEKTKVVLLQMEALKAMLIKDNALVEKYLKEATDLEASLPYDSGPPFIAYPSFEQYGDWLLSMDRPEDALLQYNKSLESRTNRSRALRGKLKALTILNRLEEAKEVELILNEFWKPDNLKLN